MRRITFSLLLICSLNTLARGADLPIDSDMTSIQINQLFVEKTAVKKNEYQDLVAKEEKVDICIDNYISKQEKSYAKIAQNNLYDLIHNFSKVVSGIYDNKKPVKDNITYEEKLEILANVQCEAYYAMGILK
jgi:hypothetical protein